MYTFNFLTILIFFSLNVLLHVYETTNRSCNFFVEYLPEDD